MSVVITTNEPPHVRNLFLDRLETPMNFDLLLYTNSGLIAIERKAVPSDLISSVEDGRLKREIMAMRQQSTINIVLLHGKITYDGNNHLIVGWHKVKGRLQPITITSWNKIGITNLLRTLRYIEGVFIEEAETDTDLVRVVGELQNYFDRRSHQSLKSRPGLEHDWPKAMRSELVMHFYQGIPGISSSRARVLYSKYKSPMDLYATSCADLDELPGFGGIMSTHVHNFLRQGCERNKCRLCQ